MRYYEVYLPKEEEPISMEVVKSLINLPEGTKVFLVVTSPDGSLVEYCEIPVKDGEIKIHGMGKKTYKGGCERCVL